MQRPRGPDVSTPSSPRMDRVDVDATTLVRALGTWFANRPERPH